MANIYANGTYLEANPSWHVEDSRWKAEQIIRMIERNHLDPRAVAEIGCGAGGILAALAERLRTEGLSFTGYDISPQAIAIARRTQSDRLRFVLADFLAERDETCFDLLLAIDVLEHVPDYMGFLTKCRARAIYKIYHVPLDVYVSSVLRNVVIRNRYTVGHLHYFTAESALAALQDTGHEIVDCSYTNTAFGPPKRRRSPKTRLANVPRWLFSRISVPFTARVFGGYSLLVLTR